MTLEELKNQIELTIKQQPEYRDKEIFMIGYNKKGWSSPFDFSGLLLPALKVEKSKSVYDDVRLIIGDRI